MVGAADGRTESSESPTGGSTCGDPWAEGEGDAPDWLFSDVRI